MILPAIDFSIATFDYRRVNGLEFPLFPQKSQKFPQDFPIMWIKQCHKPSPSHHNFYRWDNPFPNGCSRTRAAELRLELQREASFTMGRKKPVVPPGRRTFHEGRKCDLCIYNKLIYIYIYNIYNIYILYYIGERLEVPRSMEEPWVSLW